MKKLNLVPGLNCIPLVLDKSTYGINNNANKADNIAITPNNLFGIERSIAQKGKRYHSGTIAGGVCIGLAGT